MPGELLGHADHDLDPRCSCLVLSLGQRIVGVEQFTELGRTSLGDNLLGNLDRLRIDNGTGEDASIDEGVEGIGDGLLGETKFRADLGLSIAGAVEFEDTDLLEGAEAASVGVRGTYGVWQDITRR